MAKSDNVLRGGLTPKHVDAPELLRVLDFTPTTEAALRPEITRDGMELIYHTPAPEFAVPVLCIDGGSATRSPRPPAITDRRSCLCTEGSTVLRANSSALTLECGAATWVSADDGPIRLVAPRPTKLVRATIGV
jgi:mannose-6-phosphate isomerase